MKIWNAYFGKQTDSVNDPFGRKICKSNYADDSTNSWDIDHIWPENPKDSNAAQGANVLENVQPLSIISNREKSNMLQGKVNGVTYAISKVDTHEGKSIGRMSIKDDEEWVWAYPEVFYE